MTFDTILLIVVSFLVLLIFLMALVQAIRQRITRQRPTSTIGLITIILLILGLLLMVFLTYRVRELESVDLVQIILTIGLIAITASYAASADRQADASAKMAEEMREQRRPIVVQKVVSAKSVPYILAAEDITKSISSDYFEIHNEGYGPAIELEILLLDKEKRQLEKQRETFFPKVSKSPLEFYPNGLTNHVNSTCYLLCRYRGVISSDEAQLWYEAWLPFVPVKSQRGDRIIIQPKELKFSETHKKESY